MNTKIAITIRSFGAPQSLSTSLHDIGKISYINDTGKRLNEDEICNLIANVDGVIAGTEKFTRRVFESASNLRVISRVGVGLDSIDMDAAREYGVTIMNTPNSPALSVAEHTIALIFTVLKRIAIYNENMRKKDFTIKSGLLLAGRSVGIVGLGRVGWKVAEMLDILGCKIYFYDPFLPDNLDTKWIRMDTLHDMLKSVDIVTLHVPSQSDDKAIMDEEAFEYCKNGAVVINTSRGPLIDEDALIQAIEDGKVWGCGLDVFSHEPYDGKLLDYPQVVTTPHVASNTIESRQEMEKEAIENLINELRNE